MCRAFLPGMIDRRTGDVINLASVSGKRPLARRTPLHRIQNGRRRSHHDIGPQGRSVRRDRQLTIAWARQRSRMQRNFQLEAERTGTTILEVEREFVSRAALQRMVTEDEVAQAVLAMPTCPIYAEPTSTSPPVWSPADDYLSARAPTPTLVWLASRLRTLRTPQLAMVAG
jgi:NAD(P)-dependent dehydrogenase (short-subunit alcohol dehydrogenase family)